MIRPLTPTQIAARRWQRVSAAARAVARVRRECGWGDDVTAWAYRVAREIVTPLLRDAEELLPLGLGSEWSEEIGEEVIDAAIRRVCEWRERIPGRHPLTPNESIAIRRPGLNALLSNAALSRQMLSQLLERVAQHARPDERRALARQKRWAWGRRKDAADLAQRLLDESSGRAIARLRRLMRPEADISASDRECLADVVRCRGLEKKQRRGKMKTTEEERQAALDVLRRDYIADVRGAAERVRDELRAEIERRAAGGRSAEELPEWLLGCIEAVADMSPRSSSPEDALLCLLFSPNDQAGPERLGVNVVDQDNILDWSQLAFRALSQDIAAELERMGIDIDDPRPSGRAEEVAK